MTHKEKKKGIARETDIGTTKEHQRQERQVASKTGKPKVIKDRGTKGHQ